MATKGFFTKKQAESKSRPGGKSYTCASCGLYKHVLSPKMEEYGEFEMGILNVGEAPGKTEDRKGRQWQGKVGRLLQITYDELGVDLFKDCLNINSVNCFPTNSKGFVRAPDPYEVDCCRRVKVMPVIDRYKPKVIILLGGSALRSVIGSRWKKDLDGITRWRGFQIPDRDLNAWVCPVFHPSYVARMDSNEITNIWENDLRNAFRMVDVPLPEFKDDTDCIRIIDDPDDLRDFGDLVTIDYEATGLKPHRKEHQLICGSVAYDEDNVDVFMFPEDPKKASKFVSMLKDKSVKKIAHNMKYEVNWSRAKLGTRINGLKWDSMLAAHILDGRTRGNGLKFLVYVNFGVIDYSEEISSYLKLKDDKDGNALNGIKDLLENEELKRKLLLYCGLDSLYEHRLATMQIRDMPEELLEGYKLFHYGLIALQNAEYQGMRIDVEYCKTKKEELTNEILELNERFKESELYALWRQVYKDKLNLDSNAQLGVMLYDHLDIEPINVTKTGKGATDESSLSDLMKSGVVPELEHILRTRKLKKIRDTYLDGFLREQVNGVIHPFFNLNTVSTYRSSSNRPNFQNIPKRDAEAQEVCRRAIYPRKGHQLLEVDYSGIEVRIACCYTKDKKLIYDTIHGDMHGDMAVELYMLDSLDRKHKGESTLRQGAKNGFVFPQFYGDYYGNCVPILLMWAENVELSDGTPVYVHMQDQGILELDKKGNVKDADAFYEHVKQVEDQFWNVRYKTYTKWKDRVWKGYQKNGYVELKTGFRCGGVLKRNELLNRPIQGSAFHCLLWSFIMLDRISKKEKWRTKLVGQIHDAIIFDVHPDELEYISGVIRRVMCEDIRSAWDWINVPLDIEADLSPVDGSWFEQEGYKI
jgi:uracil-DNA glycosylase family 4